MKRKNGSKNARPQTLTLAASTLTVALQIVILGLFDAHADSLTNEGHLADEVGTGGLGSLGQEHVPLVQRDAVVEPAIRQCATPVSLITSARES